MSAASSPARCTRCGRPVWRAITEEGRRIQLDPDPDPDRGVAVLDPSVVDGQVVRSLPGVRILTGPELPVLAGDAWVLHTRTCPAEAARRSPRRVERPVRCRRCLYPMDPWLVDVGEDRHPTCLPELDPAVEAEAAEAGRQAADLIRRADQLRARNDPDQP